MQIELTYTMGNASITCYTFHSIQRMTSISILCLHGAAERGDDLSRPKKHDIPKIVERD